MKNATRTEMLFPVSELLRCSHFFLVCLFVHFSHSKIKKRKAKSQSARQYTKRWWWYFCVCVLPFNINISINVIIIIIAVAHKIMCTFDKKRVPLKWISKKSHEISVQTIYVGGKVLLEEMLAKKAKKRDSRFDCGCSFFFLVFTTFLLFWSFWFLRSQRRLRPTKTE